MIDHSWWWPPRRVADDRGVKSKLCEKNKTFPPVPFSPLRPSTHRNSIDTTSHSASVCLSVWIICLLLVFSINVRKNQLAFCLHNYFWWCPSIVIAHLEPLRHRGPMSFRRSWIHDGLKSCILASCILLAISIVKNIIMIFSEDRVVGLLHLIDVFDERKVICDFTNSVVHI